MNPTWILGLLTASVLSPVAPLAAESPSLKVMTFNLRYASPCGPNAWPQRRPIVRELLRAQAPDLIGTQEGLYEQLKDVATDLEGYDWIGLGREGGSRGEFMAIYFRKERLEPLAFDHFWLSDTPQAMGSKSWGNFLPRLVTWVRFRDKRTEQEFWCFNTHLDHLSQPAREKSAELIRQRVAALQTAWPVLLVGDFNAVAGKNRVYDLLVNAEAFTDTWATAQARGAAVGTFHNFQGPTKDGPRIDWILARGPVTVLASDIVTFARDGQYPSDHFPVTARVRFAKPAPR